VAETRVRCADGSFMTVSVVGAPVRDVAGEILHWVGINTDVSARKEAETQLEAANRELEAFSYSVSHDLRAPLRAIDGFSRILLDEHAGALDAEARRLLEKVVRNTQQMARLIDDLLAFSRVGRRELEPRRVKILPTVRAAAEEQRAIYPDRDFDVRLGDLPDIFGDAPMLRQVIYNLVANAFKFSHTRERPVVEAGSFEQPGETVYFVRDNGVGFDPRYADKLFGVFQRLHSTRDFEGTGVGLAIVKRVVERHGGRVWAESEPDAGATFYFSIPAGVRDRE
jgi:light-regulated signal transduction histidine kinase (bacteriophytochrome)